MTDALVYLQGAHTNAEQDVDRLHSELWWISNAGRIEAHTAGGGIQFDEIIVDGRTVTITEAVQRGLLAGNPDDLLRRITADRKILSEHRVHECGDHDCALEPHHRLEFCDACRPGVRWPCITVRALAEGWGWKENDGD